MAASGSRGRSQGSAGAGAGADALDTLSNPDLAQLPAVDLVLHLHRDDRSGSDFADVALVLAVRERRHAEHERRLAEAEARIRATDVDVAGLQERIRALELRVAKAEARARDRTAAGEDDESQAGDHLAASDVGAAAEHTGGEIRARDLGIMVPELGAGVMDSPAEVGDNDIPSPIPLMRIDASPVPVTATPALPDDELIEEGEVEQVVVDVVAVPRSREEAEAGVVDRRDKVSEAVARKRKRKQASDLPLPLDDHRVTIQKVSEEEAHDEDVVASPDRHSQGEQLARSTKKARRQKEPSFYAMVLKALKEKENLLKKREKEAAAKKAAAAASKQLPCTCWWSDSGDGESSQN